ncbi:MAG: hypothetical protein Ct9H90mP18_07520 [Gammaproteobacteria bacterium]|nr:MAG: hypothetical protein Ct9H90mP18_07520 [Gammaproteobacteria bacterium]
MVWILKIVILAVILSSFFTCSDNYYFINVYVGYMYINHWKIQRLSAIILVPAMFYLIYYLINLSNLSYNDVITDLSSLTGVLYVVLLSFFFLCIALWGLKRFLKGYVHNAYYQKFFISLSKIIHVILFLITLVCLYLVVGA